MLHFLLLAAACAPMKGGIGIRVDSGGEDSSDSGVDSGDSEDSQDTRVDTSDSGKDTSETGKKDDTGETSDTVETGDTVDTSEPDIWWNCEDVPDFNLGDAIQVGARAYHGIAFQDGGYIAGYDGRGVLTRTIYDAMAEAWVPGFGTIEGMHRLPGGDIVLYESSRARLVRVSPKGTTSIVAEGVSSVYGVTIGPDGMVYAGNGGVLRVNPDTGASSVWLRNPGVWTARVIDFNVDSTRAYIATLGRGDVYVVELDENLDPVGDPTLYASGVGSSWHDGIGVDACGYVYVAEYYTAGLYRISPDGTVVPMVKPGYTRYYGHGLQWGNGIGGWRQDALYQPQPYNGYTVREVVVSFPSADLIRTWRGVRVP
jgi:hypothetical protein